MKKSVFSLAFIATLLLVSANSQAQSLKDLFNKENVEKVVSAVTGKNTVDMTGTWVVYRCRYRIRIRQPVDESRRSRCCYHCRSQTQ